MTISSTARARATGISRRRLLAVAAATGTVAAGNRSTVTGQTPTLAGVTTDSAGLLDIGGRSLYREARGSGGPTVILEAGYRSVASVWTDDLVQPDSPREMVLPAIARRTRVCAYERPGVAAVIDGVLIPSRSDPVPMPRNAASVVSDLHAWLAVSGEPGPYVLVGHSLGGLFVRLYAATYPAEVAGLVLVDAWSEELETLLGPDEWEAYVALNSAVPQQLAGYQDLETVDFAGASAAMREAAKASPLPNLPLAVVSKGQPFGVTADQLGFAPEVLESSWELAQQGLAGLVPGVRHLIAAESSHYVQLEQPELVVEAILAVLDAVRQSPS